MSLVSIKENIKTLSRPEKFQLIQFLVADLALEEDALSQHFSPNMQHGFWSQYDAYEAAHKLQTLLESNRE
jgi:hypothetical protein